jgi:RHS repeat-associated protein
MINAGGRPVAQVDTDSTGASTTRYIYDDALGSLQTTTSADGTALPRRDFGPFGEQRNSSANLSDTSYGFTSHEHDTDLGLINMRGRLYDPEIGQFLQPDPFVTRPFSQGLNRFAYAENSPLNLVDPTGLANEPPGQGGGTCIIGSRDDCDVAGTGTFGGDVATVAIASVGATIGVYGLGHLAIQGATAAGWIKTGDVSQEEAKAAADQGLFNEGNRRAALGAANTGLALNNIPGDQRRVPLPTAPPNAAPNSGLGQGAPGAAKGVQERGLTEVLRNVQHDLDAGEYTRAVAKAGEYYGLDSSEVWLQYNPIPLGNASATTSLNDGRLTTNIYDNGVVNARWLLSTVYHEGIHVRQAQQDQFAPDENPLGQAVNEVEALDAEIRNGTRLGLSPDEMASLRKSRGEYFNSVNPFYQQRILQGNYRLRPSELVPP